jgi:hypothetical protein
MRRAQWRNVRAVVVAEADTEVAEAVGEVIVVVAEAEAVVEIAVTVAITADDVERRLDVPT